MISAATDGPADNTASSPEPGRAGTAPARSGEQPLPSALSDDGQPVTHTQRNVKPGPSGSISEMELMALLGKANAADTWPEATEQHSAEPTPLSALADHAAGTGGAPGDQSSSEHDGQAGETGPGSSISEMELMALLGDAYEAGEDSHEPQFPPPDVEPAAAKAPERQLGQDEIDALLAKLLGN
jgi:hypothetical protein